MDSIAVIICAAGASSRMGGIKKEYRPLPAGSTGGANNPLTVLGAAVSAFATIPEIETIVIVVPVNEEAAARNALPSAFLSAGNKPAIHFVSGGATRQASVFNALSLLAAQCAHAQCAHAQRAPGLVLIHDGARPWVSPALIRRVIAGTQKYRAVIPLLPLTETPKEIDGEWGVESREGDKPVFIKRHLKRALVGGAQTPQGFSFPEIFAAHQQAAVQDTPIEYTDDAEVWSAFCGPVAAIPGESENRKITFPEDL